MNLCFATSVIEIFHKLGFQHDLVKCSLESVDELALALFCLLIEFQYDTLMGSDSYLFYDHFSRYIISRDPQSALLQRCFPTGPTGWIPLLITRKLENVPVDCRKIYQLGVRITDYVFILHDFQKINDVQNENLVLEFQVDKLQFLLVLLNLYGQILEDGELMVHYYNRFYPSGEPEDVEQEKIKREAPRILVYQVNGKKCQHN